MTGADAQIKDYYKEKVRSLTNLPTVPLIAGEILRIQREDKFSVKQMLPIIEKDPPLVLKILKIANSAYYGIRDKIENLNQAIVIIGLNDLTHLVLGFSIVRSFSSSDKNDQWLDWNHLWEHSAACGHVAQLFTEKLKIRTHASMYSLGLLHDIGKLVLFRLDEKLFADMAGLIHSKQLTSIEAELETFGITHEDAGKWLAEMWGLPPSITNAIGFHHNPELVVIDAYKESTALIQLADMVCQLRSINFLGEYLQIIPRDESGWSIISQSNPNLQQLDFEKFILSMDDEVEKIQRVVELTRI